MRSGMGISDSDEGYGIGDREFRLHREGSIDPFIAHRESPIDILDPKSYRNPYPDLESAFGGRGGRGFTPRALETWSRPRMDRDQD